MKTLPAFLAVILPLVLSPAYAAEPVPPAEEVLVGCPDPAIIAPRDGSGYYVFSTGRGIPIWHSDDLVRWRSAGRVFSSDAPTWAKAAIARSSGIWAPDIAFVNGLYHLYYSVSTFGSQRSVIGLAVNKALNPASKDYRWEDRGLVIESHSGRNDFNAIDPALFVDADGTAYLFWGSYWTGIKATRINPATGKPQPDAPIVPVASRAKGIEPPAIEAPYVIFRNGYYYLFVSWDFCCAREKSTYKVVVGRSKSLLGPYLDWQGRPMTEGGGTLVLASTRRWRGPGHNSFLHTDRGDWLVHATYDVENLRRGRVLQVRPMYWLDDGWPVPGEPISRPASQRDDNAGPVSVAGKWNHDIDFTIHLPAVFRANGTIEGTRSGAAWKQEGSSLLLQWHDSQAPGGVWTDRAVLEQDGNSYVGRNQRGQVVRGVREPPP